MAMQFLMQNSPMQTAAAPPKVATGTAIKTMLQVFLGASPLARVIEWGFSFDGAAAATPGVVELIETDGSSACTVTAYAAADITAFNADALLLTANQKAVSGTTAMFQISTSTSGYTSTVEGTNTTLRNLDGTQLAAPTTELIKQFPLGREPLLQNGKFLKIRATFGTTINMLCYVILEI